MIDVLGELPPASGRMLTYTKEQMHAERERCCAIGAAAERERWRTTALAGCDGTHPKYAEALRNLVAMMNAGTA